MYIPRYWILCRRTRTHTFPTCGRKIDRRSLRTQPRANIIPRTAITLGKKTTATSTNRTVSGIKRTAIKRYKYCTLKVNDIVFMFECSFVLHFFIYPYSQDHKRSYQSYRDEDLPRRTIRNEHAQRGRTPPSTYRGENQNHNPRPRTSIAGSSGANRPQKRLSSDREPREVILKRVKPLVNRSQEEQKVEPAEETVAENKVSLVILWGIRRRRILSRINICIYHEIATGRRQRSRDAGVS